MTGLALADFTTARVGGDAAAVSDLAEAETGAGLVVGGSLGYALPAWGLTRR